MQFGLKIHYTQGISLLIFLHISPCMRVIGLSLSKELAIQANGIYNFDALGIGAKLDSKTAFQIRSPMGHP